MYDTTQITAVGTIKDDFLGLISSRQQLNVFMAAACGARRASDAKKYKPIYIRRTVCLPSLGRPASEFFQKVNKQTGVEPEPPEWPLGRAPVFWSRQGEIRRRVLVRHEQHLTSSRTLCAAAARRDIWGGAVRRLREMTLTRPSTPIALCGCVQIFQMGARPKRRTSTWVGKAFTGRRSSTPAAAF